MTSPAWIAVDWGMTHLRAWALSGAGDVLDRASTEQGAAMTDEGAHETVLLDVIGKWLEPSAIPVLACGAIGAHKEFAEVKYGAVPTKPVELTPVRIVTSDPRLNLSIVPGLNQKSPPDVMRGEECQILGALTELPDFDGVIALPGTHTKWAQISAEEVVSFQSAMTGELFALLADHSILRHSVSGKDMDGDAFDEALSQTLSRPEKLAQKLFQIRADGLLNGPKAASARGHLSGLLIGAELAATRPYWLGQRVLLCGDPQLTGLYERGLKTQGVECIERSGETHALAGLAQIYKTMTEAAT